MRSDAVGEGAVPPGLTVAFAPEPRLVWLFVAADFGALTGPGCGIVTAVLAAVTSGAPGWGAAAVVVFGAGSGTGRL